MRTSRDLAAAVPLLAFFSALGCGVPPSPPAVPAVVPVASVEPRPAERCADEAEPCTWVKRLEAPETRVEAVTRLSQLHDEQVALDRGDPGGPHVKPLLEVAVEPLIRHCVAGDVGDPGRAKLVKLLADARDARAEPCLVKTLKDYQPDRTEDDVRVVSRAVAAMKLRAAAGPLMEVFTALHASRPRAQSAYRDVHDAMIALADPAWEGALIGSLGRPVDQRDQAAFVDQAFWQITAVELLGHLRSPGAVKPLLRLLLAPQKAVMQGDAVLSLVKIGKPSIGPTVALLRGEDKELVELSRAETLQAAGTGPHDRKEAENAAAVAHVGAAALVLSTLGREECVSPLLEALGKQTSDLSRAALARELTRLPRSPRTIKAFRDTYEKLPVSLTLPGTRGGAREVLLDVAPAFFDASFVPWIARTVKTMKGADDDLAILRGKALEVTLKLATRDQIRFIDDLASMKGFATTLGQDYDKEIKLAKGLLAECGDAPDCLLGKLTDPSVNTDERQFVGIKAAYLLGELGLADIRTRIMAVYPRISHPAIRFAALALVDASSPRGDVAVAAQLRKIVDDAIASKDPSMMRFNGVLKQFIVRFEARAAP